MLLKGIISLYLDLFSLACLAMMNDQCRPHCPPWTETRLPVHQASMQAHHRPPTSRDLITLNPDG
jgi:hypothetical protein